MNQRMRKKHLFQNIMQQTANSLRYDERMALEQFKLTDEEIIEREMGNQAVWDDPFDYLLTPDGEIDLPKMVAWQRGYIEGRSVVAMNVKGSLDHILFLMKLRRRI